MNPFKYHKSPKTVSEAQETINYWWYEGMIPNGVEVYGPLWKHYIREFTNLAAKQKNKLENEKLIDNTVAV